MNSERDLSEEQPWIAEGVTVYQWIAARPELHSLSHWKVDPVPYKRWGKNPSGCGIYFLMNAKGGCHYIGQSVDIETRLLAHWTARKVPFTHVWTIKAPEGALNALEAFLIRLNRPEYNVRLCQRMREWAEELERAMYPEN